jgi:transcriptional regulator with XRE-family HTH domain
LANKRQPIIVDPENFPAFLAGRYPSLGGSMAALAEFLGVSSATVYQLLNGTLKPGPEVLKRAGLRMAYILDVDAVEADDEPPAKPKGKKPGHTKD